MSQMVAAIGSFKRNSFAGGPLTGGLSRCPKQACWCAAGGGLFALFFVGVFVLNNIK